MSEKHVQTIRLVGGHPALDFVNTVDSRVGRWGPDVLATYNDALEWGGRIGLLNEADCLRLQANGKVTNDLAAETLARLLAAREHFYEVFLAEAEQRPANIDAVGVIRTLVSAASGWRRLVEEGDRYAWNWRDDGDELLHRLAFTAGELLTDRARRTIRVCPGPHCGWLFLDRSHSGRRRWCSQEGCGSHSRVRRFRSKREQE